MKLAFYRFLHPRLNKCRCRGLASSPYQLKPVSKLNFHNFGTLTFQQQPIAKETYLTGYLTTLTFVTIFSYYYALNKSTQPPEIIIHG